MFINSKEGELAFNIYESVKNNNKDKWYNILESSKMTLIFPTGIVSKLKKLDFKIIVKQNNYIDINSQVL